MLNLVNQNKQHARKHTAILQVMTTWRSYNFATYQGYMILHKSFRINQYLWFHKIYDKIVGT